MKHIKPYKHSPEDFTLSCIHCPVPPFHGSAGLSKHAKAINAIALSLARFILGGLLLTKPRASRRDFRSCTLVSVNVASMLTNIECMKDGQRCLIMPSGS